MGMFSLWSDLFNFIVGISLFTLGGTHVLLAAGYLIFHFASILYLILFKKLGFKYHLKTTRLLILVPQFILFIWSLACFLLVIITEYCICSKNVHSGQEKDKGKKVVIEMPRKAARDNSQHRSRKLYPDSDVKLASKQADVQYANEQVQPNAPPMNY